MTEQEMHSLLKLPNKEFAKQIQEISRDRLQLELAKRLEISESSLQRIREAYVNETKPTD